MLDVGGLYLKKFSSYRAVTSHGALAAVARETGMGYSSNISDTDDRQTWINHGTRVCSFIEDVVARAHSSSYGSINLLLRIVHRLELLLPS